MKKKIGFGRRDKWYRSAKFKQIGQDMCSPSNCKKKIFYISYILSGIHVTDYDEVETSILSNMRRLIYQNG